MSDFEERRSLLLAEIASLFEFFSPDMPSLLERCIEISKRIRGFDEYALLLLQSSGRLHPFLSSGVKMPEEGSLELSDFYSGDEVEYVIGNLSATSRNPLFPQDGHIRSVITIPLIMRADVIGLFVLGSREKDAFSAEDTDLFFSLGSHFAVAIQNLRNYQLSHERLEMITALQESYRSINAEEGLAGLLRSLSEDAVARLGATAMVVYLSEDGGRQWRRNVCRSEAPTAVLPELLREEELPSPVKMLLSEPRMTFLSREDREEMGRLSFSRRRRDLAVLPLRSDSETPGGFAILEFKTLEPETLQIIELFASQIQVLFANAMMIENMKRKSLELERSAVMVREYAERLQQSNEMLESSVKELTTLHNVSVTLSQKSALDEILEHVLSEGCAVMRAEKGSIALVEGDELVGRSSRGIENKKRIRFRVGDGIAGMVAKTGKPYIVRNVGTDPNYRTKTGETPREETLLCVPLTLENRVVGVMSIERALKHGPFTVEDKRLLGSLATTVAQALERVRAFEDMRLLHKQTLEAFALAVDTKDAYTHGHSRRVSRISVMLGRVLALPQEELDCLERAALLHDIGKIGISNAILFKPGKLTDEEYEIMKAHVIFGEHIVKPIKMMAREARLIRHHHEHWNGRGYPDGLKGEELPLTAAIIACADAYDTMTSDRPYRRAMDKEAALQEVTRCNGTQFNPLVVGALLMLNSRGDLNGNAYAEPAGTGTLAVVKV